VAIDVYFHFEHAACLYKKLFPFLLVAAKLKGDYFDNRQYGVNRTFLLITRHFICASIHRCVKRDAVRARKNRDGSKLFHILRCKFGLHRH
jgi:hypothetical protein